MTECATKETTDKLFEEIRKLNVFIDDINFEIKSLKSQQGSDMEVNLTTNKELAKNIEDLKKRAANLESRDSTVR